MTVFRTDHPIEQMIDQVAGNQKATKKQMERERFESAYVTAGVLPAAGLTVNHIHFIIPPPAAPDRGWRYWTGVAWA